MLLQCRLRSLDFDPPDPYFQKQKLNLWVDSALELEGGMDPDTGMLSSYVQTALKYIDNASKDVRVSD